MCSCTFQNKFFVNVNIIQVNFRKLIIASREPWSCCPSYVFTFYFHLNYTWLLIGQCLFYTSRLLIETACAGCVVGFCTSQPLPEWDADVTIFCAIINPSHPRAGWRHCAIWSQCIPPPGEVSRPPLCLIVRTKHPATRKSDVGAR